MPNVTIRNIDPKVKEWLRLRAARNRRSMAAELRAIVAEAVENDGGASLDQARANRLRSFPLNDVELEPHPAQNLREMVAALRAMPKPTDIQVREPPEMPDRAWD